MLIYLLLNEAKYVIVKAGSTSENINVLTSTLDLPSERDESSINSEKFVKKDEVLVQTKEEKVPEENDNMTSEKEKNDEWQNRLKSYRNFCSGRNKLLSTRSQRFFLTGESEGKVHFSTCLVAKAASTSLSLAFVI